MPGRYKVSRSNTTDTQAKERDRQHHQSKVEAGSVNYRSKEMIDAVIFFFSEERLWLLAQVCIFSRFCLYHFSRSGSPRIPAFFDGRCYRKRLASLPPS